MKCKRHPCEQGAGVCASCLRDRLLIVLAEQHERPSPDLPRGRRNPPSVLLPLSSAADTETRSSGSTHRRSGGFSLFPSLFRSGDNSSSSGGGSWISTLIHRRKNRKNQKKKQKVQAYGPSDRGMSPAIDDHETGSSASGSGYTTESSAVVGRHTTPARPSRRHGSGGGFSGFGVCLNPVGGPGHAGRRRRPTPSEAGFSAELGRNGYPVQLQPNRSKKLADRGRNWR